MNRIIVDLSREAARFVSIALICVLLPGGAVWAKNQLPLNKIPVPRPDNLSAFVQDEAAAIRLGKALFWDMQAGSDGKTACATCHYKAGADPLDVRSRNQLHPGPDNIFDIKTGAGETLSGADFPFFQVNPVTGRLKIDTLTGLFTDPTATITRDFNDVAGSQGVLKTDFTSIAIGLAEDSGSLVSDPTFSSGGQNVRQVTGRNSPSVINAVFNFTNFFDGRGNNIFNGETPFGPLDQNAGIWIDDGAALVKQTIAIPNAALASQAVGPPLNDVEMSYKGRTFPELGRKMLNLTPLGLQHVATDDSVLGGLSRDNNPGLNADYESMIEDAFTDTLWNSSKTVSLPTVANPGGEPFSQMEANFSLFWGLAIQLYEASLISDWTPFDRFQGGNQNALTLSAQNGLSTFDSKCSICHSGSELTDAVVGTSTTVIPTCALRDCNPLSFVTTTNHTLIQQNATLVLNGLSDLGFSNLGVRPTADDAGRGGNMPVDLGPFPLSFTLLAQLGAQDLLPPDVAETTPSLNTPLLQAGLASATTPTAVNGSFKTPGLRNVELTAPYFHNGSTDDLLEVVEFYARGGNFPNSSTNPELSAKMDPIGNLRADPAARNEVVLFMQALTDKRVADELAPFDHPELLIPSGDIADIMLTRPATGGFPEPVTLQTFTMTTGPAASTLATSVTITGLVQDSTTLNDVVNVEVLVNGVSSFAAITGTTWTFTATTLNGMQLGPNTLSAIASTPTSTVEPLIIDAAFDLLPTATLFGVPTGAVNFKNVNLTVSGNGVSSYRYSLDGGAFSADTPVADKIVLDGLADATHTLAVVGKTLVNEIPFEQPEANATTATWTVKATPPVLTLNPVVSPGREASQTLSGTMELGRIPKVTADAGATVGTVSVVSDTWSCQLSNLNKGTNNITISVTDVASNVTTLTTTLNVIFPDGCFRGTDAPDVTDAVKALRIAVGLVDASTEDLFHGDVSPLVDGVPAPDGAITADDALVILRKVVGLISF